MVRLRHLLFFAALCLSTVSQLGFGGQESVTAHRLLDRPIITPSLDPTLGTNIQGPSLIRTPDWIEKPLGRYYLYFADHKGGYIRLAYADDLIGPWKIHAEGTLQLNQTSLPQAPPAVDENMNKRIEQNLRELGITRDELPHDLNTELSTPHIASPDVHADYENKRIVMYFHGLTGYAKQATRVAISADGINFTAHDEDIARTYLRVFEHDGYKYGIAMPGQFYRSEHGLTDFELGPLLFEPTMRHSAVLKRDNILYVFWSRVGSAPETILVSIIDISGPWESWRIAETQEVLRPERIWEGADLPLSLSQRSVAYGPVNQLRDPCIYTEGDRIFLLYSVAGESGIAIAEIKLQQDLSAVDRENHSLSTNGTNFSDLPP